MSFTMKRYVAERESGYHVNLHLDRLAIGLDRYDCPRSIFRVNSRAGVQWQKGLPTFQTQGPLTDNQRRDGHIDIKIEYGV